MLTQTDINWIKANRADITQNRTVPVTLVHITEGTLDPFTKEPSTSETTEVVNVTWSEYSTITNGDITVINGVELRKDDVEVTFDANVVLSDVDRLTDADGVDYVIITVDKRGIGATNRQECVIRRRT